MSLVYRRGKSLEELTNRIDQTYADALKHRGQVLYISVHRKEIN